MAAFTAQYHGTCEECTGPITPGADVVYNVRDDLVHVECPDPLRQGLIGTRCPRCFAVHPGEC